MSSPQTTNNNPVAPERLAEAGVWISRLHGGNRTRADEIGLQRWLREDPENARAFEIATEVWDDAENLRRFAPLKPKFLQRPRSSMAPIFSTVAMASVLLILGALLLGIGGFIYIDPVGFSDASQQGNVTWIQTILVLLTSLLSAGIGAAAALLLT